MENKMTQLRFYDPHKKFGEFSNLATVPVTLEGVTYPTVQHAVYMRLLGSYGDRLAVITNPYDLRKNYELQLQLKFNDTVSDAIFSAYSARLKKDPVKLAKTDRNIVYKPSRLLDSKIKYILGVDQYLYGYNMIGKTIEEIYHGVNFNDPSIRNAIYLADLAANRLTDLLKEGSNLRDFQGILPSQVLEILGYSIEELLTDAVQINLVHKQFLDGTLKQFAFVKNEIFYPRSLAFFLLKSYSPFLNFYIHNNIQDVLLFDFGKQILSSEYDVPSNIAFEVLRKQVFQLDDDTLQSHKNRLLELYAHNKLPITKNAFLVASNLIKNRLTDEQIHTYLNFIPMNFVQKGALELDDSGKHPLDPFYVVPAFEYKGFTFFTIIHCIYFIMIDSLLNNQKKTYSLLLKKPNKKVKSSLDFVPPESFVFDEMYNKIFMNEMVSVLKRSLDYKFETNPTLTQMLLQSEKDGISGFIYTDPYDPVLGYDENLSAIDGNFMNQTGKHLLELRAKISVDVKLEYNYFYELCGDNLFLHSWLKKQLLDLRTCLFYFRDIYNKDGLDAAKLKLFFSKIYTPYHTIYRYENTTSAIIDGFVRHFFKDISLTDEDLIYIMSHFQSVYTSSLKNFDNDRDSLVKHIRSSTAVTEKPNPEVILKKLYSTLQYLPNKYSRETLSNLVSLYMISPSRIEIPEKTFFSVGDNSHVYMYMISEVFYLFKQMSTLSHNTIGSLSFCVNHIIRNISSDNYRFFF